MPASFRPDCRVALLTAVGIAATSLVALFAAPAGLGELLVVLWPAAVLAVATVVSVAYLARAPGRDLDRLARKVTRRRGATSETGGSRLVSNRPVVWSAARTLERFGAELDEGLSRKRLARLNAEEADRTETAFLTDLSHELRTPLNAILGFSDVLLGGMDGPLTDSQREDVETIKAAGAHLGELVDDVLDLASLYSGTVTLKRTPLDVTPLLRDVARLLEAQRRGKPIEIRLEVASDVPKIDADEKRVRQIVMNLGTNAIKFTDRGEIVLRADAVKGAVLISVSDTGPGIARSEQDTIFLEFTQLTGSVRKSQGSGLGLAICKRLTELHEGRIWLESVVGEGSSFYVELPRAEDD